MKPDRIRGRRLQQIRKHHFMEHPWCAMCLSEGKKRIAVELDHIVALCNGGQDADDNRQGLCKRHHDEKTAKDLGHKPRRVIGVDGYPVDDM